MEIEVTIQEIYKYADVRVNYHVQDNCYIVTDYDKIIVCCSIPPLCYEVLKAMLNEGRCMTGYEAWQLVKKGNVIPEKECVVYENNASSAEYEFEKWNQYEELQMLDQLGY